MQLLAIIFRCLFTAFLCGCSVPKRMLIINADDVGMSRESNEGVLQAIKGDVLTSASLMVPAPAFAEAELLAREHPDLSWGLHLTLTSEWETNSRRWKPLLSRDEVPSLVDDQGYLWRTTEEVATNAKIEEVANELRAQIDLALNKGIPISHFDTHMYALFDRKDFLELYVTLAIDYNIPILLFQSSTPSIQKRFEETFWATQLERLTAAGLTVVDYYNGANYNVAPERKENYLIETIKQIPEGVSVIAVHPAVSSPSFTKEISDANSRYTDLTILQNGKLGFFCSILRVTDHDMPRFCGPKKIAAPHILHYKYLLNNNC